MVILQKQIVLPYNFLKRQLSTDFAAEFIAKDLSSTSINYLSHHANENQRAG